MSKHAVSKTNLLFGTLVIVVLASMVVMADNTTTNTSVTISTDTAIMAPSDQSVPANLSTPIQVLRANNDANAIPDGYLVNAQVVLNTSGYNCTITNDGKEYVTCDSIYDGNGDGKCTSGESCIQFGIVGSYVTRKERNSQDNFADHDDTFTLRRPEVTQ